MRVASLASAALLFATAATAADITVLSGGAIEPGLRAAVSAFEKQSGHAVRVTFNTAPQIQKRVEGGDKFDIVIAPPAVIEPLAKLNAVVPGGPSVGRVGLGVAVREGAAAPDIATTDALRKTVLDADAIVFNRASTGQYFEGLLRKMDLWTAVEGKVTRYADGASVLDHVRNGKGRDVAFAAITEILLYKDKGIRFVGPLPADVQNYTSYTASLTPQGNGSASARELAAYFATPQSRQLFAAAGVE
ncbi:MAG: substrate-binding domain-containing protein [Burkholderiales bacterium]